MKIDEIVKNAEKHRCFACYVCDESDPCILVADCLESPDVCPLNTSQDTEWEEITGNV